MILTYLAWGILVFTGMRFFVVFTNIITHQILKSGIYKGTDLVSILIPCRNEEENIGALLEHLVHHDYPYLEILIYDDESTDTTAEIIHKYAERFPQIKYIKGIPLPTGWSGKVHACYQLAQHAKGTYFLFTDADVTIRDGLISSTLLHLQKKKLHLLSLFPQQTMISVGEKITVPVMNWILVSFLPLICTRISKRPSLSAANGQFLLFRADTYREYQFHRILKKSLVEDITIFKMMKKRHLKSHTMLSNKMISCRMYHNYTEAIDGFSKNIKDFFSGFPFMLFFTVITIIGPILILYALSWQIFMIYCILAIAIQIGFSYASGQNMGDNLLYMLPQRFSFLHMVIKALRMRKRGAFNWKGREIKCEK